MPVGESYAALDKLYRILNLCYRIIHEYKVPKAVYDKAMKNIKFIDSQIDQTLDYALDTNGNMDAMVNTINKTYIPYASNLYDKLRWNMNKLQT